MPTTGAATNTALNDFIGKLETQILNPLITLLALAAFLLFLWGVLEYIRGADSDEKRKIGQQHIFWGLIGLVIIFGAGVIVTSLNAVANQLF